MVNKVVFDYLKDYHGKYNLEDLKKKILSAGYSQEDIDEAIRLLGLEGSTATKTLGNEFKTTPLSQTGEFNKSSFPIEKSNSSTPAENVQNPLDSSQTQPAPNSSGVIDFTKQQNTYDPYKPKRKFKWMRLAGILGIIYLMAGILFSIIGYFYRDSLQGNTSFMYAVLGIGGVLFISVFFFIYGFVKMGKHANSGALVFAGKSMIVLIILLILLVGGLFAFVFFVLGGLTSGITGNAVNSADFTSLFGGLGISENIIQILTLIGIYFFVILGIMSLLGLFALIVLFCFFIGLIHAGKEVKFAKPAGVLGIIVLILLLIVPPSLAGIMVASPDLISPDLLTLISGVIGGLWGILGFLIHLFIILAFFNASRKFETN